MYLKTKVIIISISVGFVVVTGFIGYMAYFVVKDTLKPIPKDVVTKNLFIEKDSIDIANFRKTENTHNCRNLYHSIWNSIYEDWLNGFLDEDQQENEKQYQLFWKRLNFAFIEQFITLADRYFDQSNWNDNISINQCITEIKNAGFVESKTPIWNSLQDFENSINWFNSTQNCISNINSVIYREDYFLNNNLSAITQNKNNLISQNCRKSSYLLSRLKDAFENLKNSSYRYFSSKITQYRDDFFSLGNSAKDVYRDTAYMKLNEVSNNVQQWNTIFDRSGALNLQLYRHKVELDAYYHQ